MQGVLMGKCDIPVLMICLVLTDLRLHVRRTEPCVDIYYCVVWSNLEMRLIIIGKALKNKIKRRL